MKTENIKTSKHEDIYQLVKKDGKIIIVCGEYKAVNKVFDTFEQADNYIASKPYKLIFNTFQILQNYAKEKNNANAQETNANTENNK